MTLFESSWCDGVGGEGTGEGGFVYKLQLGASPVSLSVFFTVVIRLLTATVQPN